MTDDGGSWRDEISFSKRTIIINQIAEVYQKAFPEANLNEARSKAREGEENALTTANSQKEYEDLCQNVVASYNALIYNEDDSPDIENDTSTSKPVTKVGHYDNCTHHYTGLFSTIYRAPSPTDSSQLLAIKVTSPASEQPPHDSRREARILKSQDHPNIIKLLSIEPVPHRSDQLLIFPFLALTLEDCLHATKRRTIPKTILHDLFSALTYLHHDSRVQIIHRDIKPANILLKSAQGPAILADFGIAWSGDDISSEEADAKITDIGTTSYRAPELLFGCKDYSHAVDLWASGCVAAEVIQHNATCHSASRQETSSAEADWTLFSAGALGSELALIKSIFSTLGTPHDHSTWPEARTFPDWGKMTFVEYEARKWHGEILDDAVDEDACRLVEGLVRYESCTRWDSKEVLKSTYFKDM